MAVGPALSAWLVVAASATATISFTRLPESSTPAADDGRVLVRSLDASPGERLILDLPGGGDVEVLTWDRRQVWIRAFADDDATPALRLTRDAGGLRLSAPAAPGRVDRGAVRYLVRVPERFDLAVRSAGGDLRIVGLTGEVTGDIEAGDISLQHLDGALDLRTQAGELRISDAHLSGRASTAAGDLVLERVTGDLSASTLAGLTLRVGTGDTRAAHQVLTAPTDGWLEAPGDLEVRRDAGDIRIGTVRGTLVASTHAGDIAVRAAHGPVRATTAAGNISLSLADGPARGRSVVLSAEHGDVRLDLPADLDADLEVVLSASIAARDRFRMESDVPLRVVRPTGAEQDDEYLVGTARLGRGGDRIRIEAREGDVRIVRRAPRTLQAL